MIINKCWLDIYLLEEPNSLKEKRRVIKSLKDQLTNKFKISVAEVGNTELWQRSEFGIAFVTKDAQMADKVYSKIINYIDSKNNIEIIDIFFEKENINTLKT